MEHKAFLLEGLLPADIWNFIVVALILFGVFIAAFKGVILIRDEIRKSRERKRINKGDVTDEIADKVMKQLSPDMDTKMDTKLDSKFAAVNKKIDEINRKIDDIDDKLRADKELLRTHTTQLNDHESRVGRLEGSSRALCHGMLALLERDPALVNAQRAMKSFLIDGTYDEKDWE